MTGGLLTEDQERFPAFPASPRGRGGGQLGDHSLHGRVAEWLRLSFGNGRGDGGKLSLLIAGRVYVKPVLCILSRTTAMFELEGGFWHGCSSEMWSLGL